MNLRNITSIVSFGAAFLLQGCGAKTAALGNGTVAVGSKAFATAAGATAFALPEVSEFKICVASIKLVGPEGKAHIEQEGNVQSGDDNDDAVESSDDRAEIKFSPGLIDLSAGKEVSWGSLKIPTGFSLSKLKIKVKKDKEKCGVDYSVRFNGQEANEDIEFKWKFNPAVAIDANTSQLTLSFASVVSALRAAAEAGSLDQMKNHVEALEDEGQEHGLDEK